MVSVFPSNQQVGSYAQDSGNVLCREGLDGSWKQPPCEVDEEGRMHMVIFIQMNKV